MPPYVNGRSNRTFKLKSVQRVKRRQKNNLICRFKPFSFLISYHRRAFCRLFSARGDKQKAPPPSAAVFPSSQAIRHAPARTMMTMEQTRQNGDIEAGTNRTGIGIGVCHNLPRLARSYHPLGGGPLHRVRRACPGFISRRLGALNPWPYEGG